MIFPDFLDALRGPLDFPQCRRLTGAMYMTVYVSSLFANMSKYYSSFGANEGNSNGAVWRMCWEERFGGVATATPSIRNALRRSRGNRKGSELASQMDAPYRIGAAPEEIGGQVIEMRVEGRAKTG